MKRKLSLTLGLLYFLMFTFQGKSQTLRPISSQLASRGVTNYVMLWYRDNSGGDLRYLNNSNDVNVYSATMGQTSPSSPGAFHAKKLDVVVGISQTYGRNDEFRSFGFVNNGTSYTPTFNNIVVYDDGYQSQNDDYTEIRIKQLPPVGMEYVINSFQQNYEDAYVSVNWHKKSKSPWEGAGSYLDGKVSSFTWNEQ